MDAAFSHPNVCYGDGFHSSSNLFYTAVSRTAIWRNILADYFGSW